MDACITNIGHLSETLLKFISIFLDIDADKTEVGHDFYICQSLQM